MIYLDNAGTTKMFDECLAVYGEYACQTFFNPSAGYMPAINVAKDLDKVRRDILCKLGAGEGDIIFTGGATESNNLAIMGSKRNGHWNYVFSMGEHPSVYNVAKELLSLGYEVRFVKLDKTGHVDYEDLKRNIDSKTRLISVMHVSNETGVINDIQAINILRKKLAPQSLLHVDGVQAFCKIPLNLNSLGVDFYTISAHKFHGPKGVGALYVRKPQSIKNIIFGGGQENGYRSGTENVGGIMAMGRAVNLIDVDENFKHVSTLKNCMLNVLEGDERVKIISSDSPYILSAGFSGVNGETLMRVLQDKGIYVGRGSACSTKKAGNRILESMGIGIDEIKSHIRISFGGYESVDEVTEAGKIILQTYNEIWEKVK